MTSQFTYFNYVGVAIQILARPRFKAAWLNSAHFFADLELLYSLHLMTTQEWRERAGPAAAFLKSREAAPPENLKDVAALRAWAPYAFRAAAARAEAPPVECLE